MLRTTFQERLKQAMHAKDEPAVSTLRLIIAAMKDRDIAARGKGNWDGITDEEVLSMLQSMIKQRQESIRMYQQGNRPELAEREASEIRIIEGFLPKQYLEPTQAGLSIGMLATFLGVGIIEECCKFIPLALILWRKAYFNEHTDGIIFFALAGLGFGLPENIMYTATYGAGAGWMRLILTPFFHAATTAMAGYFLAKSKVEHRSLWLPVVALAGVAVLHGLYDAGMVSGNLLFVMASLMITAGMTAMLFVLFMRAGELDADQGLLPAPAVGPAFCRHCGQPNPNHTVHCTHCGQYA